MRKFAMLFIMISLVIYACDSPEKDGVEPRLQAPNDRRTSESLSNVSVEAQDTTVSESVNLPDTLIYTTYNALYRWDFEESASPVEIASDIDPTNISWSPDNSFFIYGEHRGDTELLIRYDIASAEQTELLDLERSQFGGLRASWDAENWSPDGQWFVLYDFGPNQEVRLVAADGSKRAISLGTNSFPSVLWTADGQAFSYTTGIFSPEVTDPQIEEVMLHHLETGGSRDFTEDIDLDAINEVTDAARILLLIEAIEEAGFSVVRPEYFSLVENQTLPEYSVRYPEAIYTQDFNAAPTYCYDWAIEQNNPDNGDTIVVYETSDTNNLSAPVKLADNSLIFLKFYFPDCEFGTPVGELLRLMPDGTLELISNELASAADSDEFRGFWSGQTRYRVSPDLSHVLWLSFDKYGLERTLNVTDLETMTSRTVDVNGEPLMDVVTMFWVE